MVPPGVEASVRQGAGKRLVFLISHNDTEAYVTIEPGKRELIEGEVLGGQVILEPYGVAAIEW